METLWRPYSTELSEYLVHLHPGPVCIVCNPKRRSNIAAHQYPNFMTNNEHLFEINTNYSISGGFNAVNLSILAIFNRATHSIARSLQRVCLSVRLSHSGIVSKRLNLSYNFFDYLVAPSFWLFLTPAPIPNSEGNPFSGGYIYTGVGKLAIFDETRRLSRKRCEIGRWLLWNVKTLIGSRGCRIDWYHFQ